MKVGHNRGRNEACHRFLADLVYHLGQVATLGYHLGPADGRVAVLLLS